MRFSLLFGSFCVLVPNCYAAYHYSIIYHYPNLSLKLDYMDAIQCRSGLLNAIISIDAFSHFRCISGFCLMLLLRLLDLLARLIRRYELFVNHLSLNLESRSLRKSSSKFKRCFKNKFKNLILINQTFLY